MKVLHVVGSQTSHYYYDLSLLYTPHFLELFPELTNIILLARLDGTWSIPDSVSPVDIDAAKRMTLIDALKVLQDEYQPEIVQPGMFCYKGMTSFRYLADILDIPMIGASGAVMGLTTDKWQTRALVSSAGVRVPKGHLLRPGDAVPDDMELPFILKPCREDNSMGVSLVQDESQIEDALKTAFSFDDMVLCEEFIPLGKEIRVAVVESKDGKSLEMLPTMEYFLHNNALPIRTSADKYTTKQGDHSSDEKSGAKLEFSASRSNNQVPADINDALKQKLYDLATKSHVALGCQHYSLFDVRVCPQGEPYFLEACIYCEFVPMAIIIAMGRGGNKYDNKELFYRIANLAIARYQAKATPDTQKLGMRRKAEIVENLP